jgi:hypothetical protein
LGATERHPPYGVADEPEHGDSPFQKELTSPWFFIIREFLEETLVLDSEPRTGICSWRGLKFGIQLNVEYQRALAKAFARESLELRRDQDLLDIQTSKRPCALTLHDDVTVDLMVVGGGCPEREDRGVLIVVNPLELGIEVVKVVEYELDRDNCMLDGEIFQIENHSHLVRQPIALVSLEYLFGEFGGQNFRPEFDETAVQPSVRGSPFGREDIHVWQWDMTKRQELWGGRDSGAWERGRYAEWAARFEERFRAGLGGDAASFPATFTPATAKILNLFFHRCVWGRNLTADFPARAG